MLDGQAQENQSMLSSIILNKFVKLDVYTPMKLVGLTGGIATGKSTFAGDLRHAGITIIDADELAKLVTQKASVVYVGLVAACTSAVTYTSTR